MKMLYSLYISAICTLLVSSAIAGSFKNSTGEYEIVYVNLQEVVMFKPSVIQSMADTLQKKDITQEEKIQLIKARFFVDAASINDGTSYCDVVAQAYSNQNMTSEQVSKKCNRAIKSDDFIDQIVLDPPELSDLRKVNIEMAMFFKLLVLL